MANFHRSDSFLKKTTVLENLFLDISTLPRIPSNRFDEEYVIEPQFDERPDLLAHALYESTRLWWVFTMRNLDVLQDPIRDFKAGTVIKLPSAETVKKAIGA